MADFYETPDSRVKRYGDDFRECWKATEVASIQNTKMSLDRVAIFHERILTIKFEKKGHRPKYRKKIRGHFTNGPLGIDICPYCGFENETQDGKTLRMGWDCGRCGGN